MSTRGDSEPYFRERGVEHDAIYATEFECAFIEAGFPDR
jgi:hypothetical protein